MIPAAFVMYWSATPNRIKILNFCEHNHLKESVTYPCNQQCWYLQRQVKLQGGRENMISLHSAQKCTQFRCKTSQNSPFLVCSHSVIKLYTHFIFRMLTQDCLTHFSNLTDYENIEYEDMERKEHNRYCCRLYNDIAHISERNED